MKLYILRHGDAVGHGDSRYAEDERPLTSKGIRRTRQLAHALRRMEVRFDVILSSPLTRARQTAELLARGWKQKVQFTATLTPTGSISSLIDQVNGLRPAPKTVLLVGHEPYLSSLVSLLCVGGPALPIKLKKGALCRLEAEHLVCDKCATLEWLLQPRLVGSHLWNEAAGGSESSSSLSKSKPPARD